MQKVWPWVVRNASRLIGTGVVMTGWCALTYPTDFMWAPRLYYRYTPLGVSDIAQSTTALINEVLVDLHTVGETFDTRKLMFVQGMVPFPEFTHRGDVNKGTAFIALTSGFEKASISRLLPPHVVKNMLLPEHIQKYALARQLLYAKDNYQTLKWVMGLACILAYSVLAHRCVTTFRKPVAYETIKRLLNLKYIGQEEILSLQLLLRIPALMIPLANLYWAVLCGYSRSVERHADETISKLGIEYIKGGYEFYFRSIESNKRKANPIHYRKITKDGDFKHGYIHKKTMLLTTRRDYFEDLLKQHMKTPPTNLKLVPSLPALEKQPGQM